MDSSRPAKGGHCWASHIVAHLPSVIRALILATATSSPTVVRWQVDGGGHQGVVAHVLLDLPEVDAGFEQMCGVAVTQRVGRNAAFGPAQLIDDFLDAALDGGQAHRPRGGGRLLVIASFTREQPLGMAMGCPVGAEHLKRLVGEGDQAVLVALAAADVDQHPAGVDVGDLQMEGFLQAEPERIDGPEKALQGGLVDRADELIDLGDGQDRGPFPAGRCGRRRT